jgi:hypothetical protein
MFCKKNKVILSKIGYVLLLEVKRFSTSLAFYPKILAARWKKPIRYKNNA